MGQVLYRKYRSRSFDQVVAQDHIIKTLKNSIESGRISHAYLFTGPKGVGKTSVARILAHVVNGIEYSDDSAHLDIIEIDAASNRRIDEIRDLREKVRVTPAVLPYKVFIIDEVHMLTREASNALLKTLEEPPAHAIFILATTEAHKLPETIISRAQRFTFRPVDKSQLVNHLSDIAKKEKIDITPDALELLAEQGNGSFRDAIGMLDQLSSLSETITDKDVYSFLGLPSSSVITQLIKAVQSGSSPAVLVSLEKLWLQGANPVIVSRQLSNYLRKFFVDNPEQTWAANLLKELLEVAASPDPREYLEITLLEAAAAVSKSAVPPNKGGGGNVTGETVQTESKKSAAQLKQPAADQKAVGHRPAKILSLAIWPDLLRYIHDENPALHRIVRLAIPVINKDSLSLIFEFPLHYKRMTEAKNISLLQGMINQFCKTSYAIDCRVDKDTFKNVEGDEQLDTRSQKNVSLATINNIFGAAEMLEL